MSLNIVSKNICDAGCDFIVCPTDGSFSGAGGADFEIHKRAGRRLGAFCGKLPELETGKAVLTPGFKLNNRGIIHTRGPVWQGGGADEEKLLESCYRSALRIAADNGAESLAFPLISSGSFGFPKTKVLDVAVRTISAFLLENEAEMDVFLCVYDRNSYEFSGRRALTRFLDENLNNSFGRAECVFDEALPRPESMVGAANKEPFIQNEPVSYKAKRAGARGARKEAVCCEASAPAGGIDDWLLKQDAGFAKKLFSLIDSRGMTDVECYKKANIDRRTFSKIRSNPDYRPGKQTALAFAVALKLNLEETELLLKSAGYALSDSYTSDMIVKYYILQGFYDINEINIALFDHDQPLLGTAG